MPRLLKDEPEPDPMAERLLEIYREWCREQGITPSGERDEDRPQSEPEARPEPDN